MRTGLSMVAMAIALAAPAAAASAPDWSKATRIDIAMANFNYTPSRIVLRHGEAYVLHFTNAAKGGHDFTAKSFFSAAHVVGTDAARTLSGTVALHGGESRDIRLVAPAIVGIYQVHCSHFLHESFGMKGEIVVQ